MLLVVNISSGDLSNKLSSRFQGSSVETSLLLQIGKAFGWYNKGSVVKYLQSALFWTRQ